MMRINKSWHEKNPMPKNATVDQRITWHLEHAWNCNCRQIPSKLMSEMKKRQILLE